MEGQTLPLFETEERAKLKKALECLLFASEKSLKLKDIKEILQLSDGQAKALVQELQTEYEQHRGLAIVEVAGGYQMVTRPEFAYYVTKLREPQRIRLSKAALETLAIIAYRQPITHPEIMQLRGVDSTRTLATLLEHELIKVAGRKEGPGRPKLYATTERFLEKFGLSDLSDLPPLDTGQPSEALLK